jgi:hypothetical protein
MPIDTHLTSQQWYRYAWIRDQGHTQYCEKHDKCEKFFAGDQWSKADKAALNAIRRPALTINKIISTMSTVMGEQIYNRSEISFRARNGANPKTADVLTKVFKYISDRNQLDWKRSDMFADGIIGSRGYLDVRMSFNESLEGDVVIENVNPKNVLVDPDADQYDPDTWNEVLVTKWLTVDEIALLYSARDAELLKGKGESAFPYGYDSIDTFRDRFAGEHAWIGSMYGFEGEANVNRCIRVIERQYKKLDRQLHFVYPKTGEARPVPANWDEERVKWLAREFDLKVIKKMAPRIRWTITADNVVLHDEWSPYKHFTIVPYFPYFRRGKTIGLVENLIDPQELLNKAESQNLHIINTTANSGWKVKAGSLTNMSIEELEERGAETGLVMEINGDPDKDAVKITPNSVPTGHDRLAYKAEEHIKGISNVNDSMAGQDREDVSGKLSQEKKKSGFTNLVKPLDSLVRSDFILARNTLDLVQEFMSTERILTITKDSVTGETEDFVINEMDIATGEIKNDLTIGEYTLVVTSVPQRETLEDSEFDQLVAMRKDLGVKIPDHVIVNASRLRNKNEVIKSMQGDADSPEGQMRKKLALRAEIAAVLKEEGEAKVKHEDANLRNAKAEQLRAETANPEGGTPGLDVVESEREQGREDVVAERDANRKDAESQAKIDAIQQKSETDRQLAAEKARREAEESAARIAQERVARMTNSNEKEPA